MKKLNKKGFTIVELVIVIAVIAILAAVLIPTFSGVVQKANVSADTQAARNAYTQYVAAQDANAIGSATTATYIYKGSNYFVYIEDQAVVDVDTTNNAIANCPATMDEFNKNSTDTVGYLRVADKLYQKITITPVVKHDATTAAAYNAELTGAVKAGDVKETGSYTTTTYATGVYEECEENDDGAVSANEKYFKVTSDEAAVTEKTYYTVTADTPYTADEAATYNATLTGAKKSGDVKTDASWVIAD